MKITKQKNKNVEVSQNRGDSTTRAMDLCNMQINTFIVTKHGNYIFLI